VLFATLSHFSELKSELEVLGSERNACLTEDLADALWTLVQMASDFLASHIPLLVACSPRDGAGDVRNPPFQGMVSPNQDHYGVPLPK
jgi:hypothetical protein